MLWVVCRVELIELGSDSAHSDTRYKRHEGVYFVFVCVWIMFAVKNCKFTDSDPVFIESSIRFNSSLNLILQNVILKYDLHNSI